MLVALALLVAGAAAAKKPKEHAKPGELPRIERVRGVLGGTLDVTAEGNDSAAVARAVEAAYAVALRIEYAISAERSGTEVERINASPAQHRLDLSEDLYGALDQALQVAAETEGAYDPTLGALSRIWDVHGAGRTPSTQEIMDARTRIGWTRARLEPGGRTVWLQRDSMAIDLGGIERGYTLDRMIDGLRTAGVKRALLDFGGDAIGFTDVGWSVMLRDPDDPAHQVVAVAIRAAAVATAGGDPADSVRATIFDPTTGAPVAGNASVTVVSHSAARAAALAIALKVMGRERATTFIEAQPDIGVVWLESEGQHLMGWRWRLTSLRTLPGATVDWKN